jgi:hypothetical protein
MTGLLLDFGASKRAEELKGTEVAFQHNALDLLSRKV